MFDLDSVQCFPGRPFIMPADRDLFALQFWTVRMAAHHWGCSYNTARRYIVAHPEYAVLVRVQHAHAAGPVWKVCVFAGTPKKTAEGGNPYFRRSEWQRGMAKRRWWLEKYGSKPPLRKWGR